MHEPNHPNLPKEPDKVINRLLIIAFYFINIKSEQFIHIGILNKYKTKLKNTKMTLSEWR